MVGQKLLFKYVIAGVIQFNQGASKVTFKARGRAISKAVSAAEILRSRFLQELVEIDSVRIGRKIIREEKGERLVSTIEITLARKN